MITSVRFPHSIEVLSDMDSRSTWKPGQNGIVRITRDAAGVMTFETNKAGVAIEVYPPHGTVVCHEKAPEIQPLPSVDTVPCACGHLQIDHNAAGKCVAYLRMATDCECSKFRSRREAPLPTDPPAPPYPSLAETSRIAEAAILAQAMREGRPNGPTSSEPSEQPARSVAKKPRR